MKQRDALLPSVGTLIKATGLQWLFSDTLFMFFGQPLLAMGQGGRDGAIGIIAEIGPDMEAFPTYRHLAYWAGACPGSNESAGKNKSGRITHVNKNLRPLLTQLGSAASHTQGTYFGAKYKSLVGRRRNKKGISALGRGCAYLIIKDNMELKELGPEHLNNNRKKQANRVSQKTVAADGAKSGV